MGSLLTLLDILSLLPPPTDCSHSTSGFPACFSSSGVGLGHQSALVAAGRWCAEQEDVPQLALGQSPYLSHGCEDHT